MVKVRSTHLQSLSCTVVNDESAISHSTYIITRVFPHLIPIERWVHRCTTEPFARSYNQLLIIRLIPHLAILLELYIVANKEEIYRL